MAARWFVYIIKSKANGKLYTGIALDPQKRLLKHNGIVRGGAKATRPGRPWEVVYTEGPMEKGDALRRELAIKKLRRPAKLQMVDTFLTRVGDCLHPQVEELVCQSCNWVFITPEPTPPEVTAAVEEARRLLGARSA